MRDSYTDRTSTVQHYTTSLCALEEATNRYAKLLDNSHNGGCCRRCELSSTTKFGLVRCIPKNKTVNGLAVCDKYKGKLNEVRNK
jgi:hypothetical protein